MALFRNDVYTQYMSRPFWLSQHVYIRSTNENKEVKTSQDKEKTVS